MCTYNRECRFRRALESRFSCIARVLSTAEIVVGDEDGRRRCRWKSSRPERETENTGDLSENVEIVLDVGTPSSLSYDMRAE